MVVWYRNKLASLWLVSFGLTVFLVVPFAKTSRDSRLTLLDVSHGQAALVEHGGKSYLVDTGGYFSPDASLFGATLQRILPKLDGVIISHSDADHSAGFKDVQRRQPGLESWAGQPKYLPFNGGVHNCHNQPSVTEGLYFLPIPMSLRISDNDSSCILILESKGQRIVVTGDASKRVEYYLLQTYPKLFPADLIVLGHHGSGTSSAADWLTANVGAVYAISSGDRYRPSWPAPALQRWFNQHNQELLNTAQRGTLQFTLTEQGVRLKTWDSAYRKRLIN